MIQIRTGSINTRPLRASTELSRMSSMRAALNSPYCMRAQIQARSLGNGQANGGANSEFFSYQEGQHCVEGSQNRAVPACPLRRSWSEASRQARSNAQLPLPEEVKITKTGNGKRWATSSMKVELADDILEIRDGLDKIVDAVVLNQKLLADDHGE